MLEPILIAVAAIIVVFIAIVAMRRPDFRVVRSATIAAEAPRVFAQVNDFHNWQAWSPWAKLDPTAKNIYDGAPAGTGAIFTWVGNSKVGEGTMTILESHPDALIRIRLEFRKPFRATNVAEFHFKPEGKQTVVTWSMSGRKNFLMKAFSLFMNMDKLVGGDFEKGLANLNEVVGGKSGSAR